MKVLILPIILCFGISFAEAKVQHISVSETVRLNYILQVETADFTIHKWGILGLSFQEGMLFQNSEESLSHFVIRMNVSHKELQLNNEDIFCSAHVTDGKNAHLNVWGCHTNQGKIIDHLSLSSSAITNGDEILFTVIKGQFHGPINSGP